MVSDKNTEKEKWIEQLLNPISNDTLSGAAELALQSIVVFQTVLSSSNTKEVTEIREDLRLVACKLIRAQPAMASLLNLANAVLKASARAKSAPEIIEYCQNTLNEFERLLCDSVAKIAELALDLMPPGEMVFAYSFSSTVVSCLLNARAKGRYFRVACTESRPSMEGRKLAARLAAGGIEVISTFDSAMAMLLPNCGVAFMGCDSVGRPGIVNKSGSFLLALACHEMKIPLYALCDTTKFVDDEHIFEFENHQRPGIEVWEDAPPGVTILNRQFELVPLEYISGLVTEKGLFTESDLAKYISTLSMHKDLQMVSS